MRPYTELGVAPLLVLGLLTPLAAAGVIGVMLVALITNHFKNGYFIFRPGEGYEYVLFITHDGVRLAALGGGKYLARQRLRPSDSWMYGGKGLLLALLGVLGALGLLAVFWRPEQEGGLTALDS